MPGGRPTVMDFYKEIYKSFGKDISYKDAIVLFPDMTAEVFPVFLSKLEKIGLKHDKRTLNRRLNSAKGRKAWWGKVIDTDDGSITGYSVVSLLKAQDFKCALCKKYLVKDAHRQLDHIKPISKGGKHIISNVQWLCRSCNVKKKDKYYG